MPEFGDDTFDGVIDKGTLDAMLCGGDEADASAGEYMLEVCRYFMFLQTPAKSSLAYED